LSAAAEQQLARIAARFAASHDVRINIVGHADERGDSELNDQLGSQRAQAVAQALQRAGFDPRQVQIGTRGEGAPAVLGSDPEAWEANRRVEIELVSVARPKPMGEAAQ
jgi:outer membrane protein OmpA-like peptidoglycan-associated protein